MRWVLSVLALATILLGGLWFLQGTGLVVIDPIACIGECQSLEGPSAPWTVAGAGIITLGGVALRHIWRRAGSSR